MHSYEICLVGYKSNRNRLKANPCMEEDVPTLSTPTAMDIEAQEEDTFKNVRNSEEEALQSIYR